MGIGRSIRFVAGAACGIAWALASAVSADAVVDYPGPTTLKNGLASARSPEVMVAPDGSRLAIWREQSTSGQNRVAYAQSSPAGAFGPPTRLPGDALDIAAAIAPNGTATLGWVTYDSTGGYGLKTAQLEPDGTRGPAQELAAPSQSSVPYADIVVDSQNRATIAWTRKQGATLRVRAARIAADGTPDAAQSLSDAGQDAFAPEIAVDGADRVTALWRVIGTPGTRLGTRRIDASGALEPRQYVTPDLELVTYFDLVAGDSGTVTMAWNQEEGSEDTIQSRQVQADGTMRPIRQVSADGQVATEADLAVNAADRTRIVWGSAGADNYRIRTMLLTATGKPGATTILSPEGRDADNPSIAFDSDDGAHVAWSRFDGSVRRIQATRLTAGGQPGSVSTLSPAGLQANQGTDITVDPMDRPTVAWGSSNTVDVDAKMQVTRANLLPPETTITSGPPDGSATPDETPTFEFTSNADDPDFTCSTDGGPFASCTSPLTLGPLTEGAHDFRVRATDPEGTDATPAQVDFTYDPDSDPLDTKVEGRVVKASGKQKQKGQRIRVAVKAGAEEDVEATVTGTVDPKGKAKPVDLQKIKTKPIEGGDQRKFTLTLRRGSDDRKLMKSLKRDGPAKAKVKVTLVDPSLNDTSKSVSVKVTR